MNVTALPTNGNSSKFKVVTKRGEFTIAMSFTLRTKVWEFEGEDAELAAAQELAEAIVSRHDPTLPFKPLYIFADHNTDPSFTNTIQKIRKHGIERYYEKA